ncbi:MAG: ATP-binding protein [Prochloraceae cyanobacterium]|nr:ATP-binding protein [Prochloraceae cyanobacterium]
MALFKPTKQKEKLIKQFRLQVKTELEDLNLIFDWFRKNAQTILSEQSYWQCQVALAEGFSNTVKYAHQNLSPTTPIDLEINVFANYLEIRIWDWGEEFNLKNTMITLPQINRDPLEREGGRGLQFMSQFTDDLQYIRTSNQRNCLILKKNIK